MRGRELTDKLRRIGPAGLSDDELASVVAGRAVAVNLPILAREGCAATAALMTGQSTASSAKLLAAVELGRRTVTRQFEERPRLTTPRQLASLLLPEHGSHPVERFGIVALDTKHRLLGTRIISTGSIDSTVAHPREVFLAAVALRAAAIVLFHNHPSGDPTPSSDDLVLTTRMVNAGDVMGIDVVDHLILADQRYFSMVESGRIPTAVVR